MSKNVLHCNLHLTFEHVSPDKCATLTKSSFFFLSENLSLKLLCCAIWKKKTQHVWCSFWELYSAKLSLRDFFQIKSYHMHIGSSQCPSLLSWSYFHLYYRDIHVCIEQFNIQFRERGMINPLFPWGVRTPNKTLLLLLLNGGCFLWLCFKIMVQNYLLAL